jgi:hypothetical protein
MSTLSDESSGESYSGCLAEALCLLDFGLVVLVLEGVDAVHLVSPLRFKFPLAAPPPLALQQRPQFGHLHLALLLGPQTPPLAFPLLALPLLPFSLFAFTILLLSRPHL